MRFAVWFSKFQAIFEKFDRDRSGKIDANELREALLSLGFSVSPVVLDLLVSKFGNSGVTKTKATDYDNVSKFGNSGVAKTKAIEYDNFIEYV